MKLSETGLENISQLSSTDLEHEEFDVSEFDGELTMESLGFKMRKHGVDFVIGSTKSDLKVKVKNVPLDAAKRFAYELWMSALQSENKL